MAINVYHTYNTSVEIIYYPDTSNGANGLCETTVGSMDEIQEHVCEILNNHNFVSADVCSVETGEVLMIVERT